MSSHHISSTLYNHHRCINFLQFWLGNSPNIIYLPKKVVIGFKFKPTFLYAFFGHHTSPLLNATGTSERASASGKPRRVQTRSEPCLIQCPQKFQCCQSLVPRVNCFHQWLNHHNALCIVPESLMHLHLLRFLNILPLSDISSSCVKIWRFNYLIWQHCKWQNPKWYRPQQMGRGCYRPFFHDHLRGQSGVPNFWTIRVVGCFEGASFFWVQTVYFNLRG